MKLLNLIISIVIVIASALLCYQIIQNSISNQKNKYDRAELNHIKYGLLSIDEWKVQVTAILTEEINNLYLTKATKRELRKPVEALLNTLIDKVYGQIREENSKSTKGKIKQSVMKAFINIEDIKKGIPEYADALINEITKTKTKKQLKAMLNKQLEQYFSHTFDTQNTSPINRILTRTGSKDVEEAKTKLSEEIAVKEERIYNEAMLLILLSLILYALAGFRKGPPPPSRYSLLILSLVILLIGGVTTPMIDMEATISQMVFVLMGHPVNFENQVLYFQSKSILDVFWVMITHKDVLMKIVGALLITFSILFPLLKLTASLGYYFNMRGSRNNRVINFFVFKSGKWSMADVMVVAIFMAYIGFNGIITSQFGKLTSASQELVILTTNATSLQPGYYLFLTYTVLALFLSGYLAREPKVYKRKEVTPPLEGGNMV